MFKTGRGGFDNKGNEIEPIEKEMIRIFFKLQNKKSAGEFGIVSELIKEGVKLGRPRQCQRNDPMQ